LDCARKGNTLGDGGANNEKTIEVFGDLMEQNDSSTSSFQQLNFSLTNQRSSPYSRNLRMKEMTQKKKERKFRRGLVA
jgi:hypothetical protein